MRIIGSDYDGTLNWGGIGEGKRAAIARWRAAGNLFAVVSGRGAADLLRMYREDPFGCDFLLGDNGAVIATVEGTIVSEVKCDGAYALPLIRFLFDRGCPWCDLHVGDSLRVFAETETPDDRTVDALPPIPYFTQISVMLENETEAAAITAAVAAQFGAVLNPLQNGRCIDIVRKDVNKAVGLYRLAEHVGARREDLIAVGDNINDRDMIAECYSYAMENGVDSIKALANHVTRGIAELIENEMG